MESGHAGASLNETGQLVDKRDKYWARRALMFIHEPAAINVAQILGNAAAAGAGLLAVLGGSPVLLTGTIGPLLSVLVGSILMVGGSMGAAAVLAGAWWLERIALLICAVGWVCVVPAALTLAGSGRSPGVWLVVALLAVALTDIFKRYRRIDWAYLDPTR